MFYSHKTLLYYLQKFNKNVIKAIPPSNPNKNPMTLGAETGALPGLARAAVDVCIILFLFI